MLATIANGGVRAPRSGALARAERAGTPALQPEAGLLSHISGQREATNARVRLRDSRRAARSAPTARGRMARSVVPRRGRRAADRGRPTRRRPRGCRRRRWRRLVRAVVGSSYRTRRARAPCSPTPAPHSPGRWRRRDRNPGDDPRSGLPGRGRRLHDTGATCCAMARSSAIHRIVPDACSPAMRSMTGPRAASSSRLGPRSVTSIGLCTRNSRSRRRPARTPKGGVRTSR